MSGPEQRERRTPGLCDEAPSAPETAEPAGRASRLPRVQQTSHSTASSLSARQGGDVTWATSAISPATAPTAETTADVRGSPAWERGACGLLHGRQAVPGSVPLTVGGWGGDSERAGSTAPGDGAALLVGAASEAQAPTSTHAPHHLSLKGGGHGAPWSCREK